ncbi:hypothetical protein SCHPADRAFT_934233 [Schizopora paradoxa]|uniref:Uncharacterized protein n=1 Tax=Schizopora paradoxa TaxID=27342 RepID=A0A0H2S7X7_9AGAM|nr:hypothetical protein SCHPADRAFT_934233 [Schizopora paradoxa]
MGAKRKFDDQTEDAAVYPQSNKQMKLIPFPSSEPDVDVAMSDCTMDIDMDFSPLQFHARRLSSSASSASTDSELSLPAAYPHFNLYPETPAQASPTTTYSSLQFAHHRSDCKQIPKLRVACEAGPTGSRSMWALCEECGAIEMVDS